MRRSLRSSMRAPTLDAPQEPSATARAAAMAATAPSAEASLHALGWIYMAASTFALAVNLLPHTQHIHGWSRWTLIGCAFAFGGTLWLGHQRLPGVAIDLALAGGVGLCTAGLALRGHQTDQPVPIWYIWAALSAAFLL